MTTTQKTTETTPETVDATTGRDRHMGAVKTAVAALVCSMIVGAVVATAMAHNRDHYWRFISFVGVILAALLAVMAYRKYVSHHSAPVVEETPAPEVKQTS